MSNFDQGLFSLALAGPNNDTRLWITNGYVKEDTDDQKAVRFLNEDGTPIAEGPLVTVIMQPSMVEVVCRVAAPIAGNQEGEWFPFLQRDEVVVGIPSGNEMAGPIILGRLNNALDVWPTVVAGMDTTKNNVAFRRMRTPYVVETASAYLIRSALTGAQFGIDQDGQLILNDSEGSRFFMGADVCGLSLAGEAATIQLIADGGKIAMTAGDTTNLVLSSGESTFLSQGTLNVGTGGVSGAGHAITAEQVIILITEFFTALYQTKGPSFAGNITAADISPANNTVNMNTALATALLKPITPYLLTLTAALSLPTDPTGTIPGVGRAGFLL